MRSKEEIEKLLMCLENAFQEPPPGVNVDKVDIAMLTVTRDLLLWVLGLPAPFVEELYQRIQEVEEEFGIEIKAIVN